MKTKLFLITILLVNFNAICIFSQNHEIDSLNSLLSEHVADDTVRVKLLIETASLLGYKNDSSLILFNNALELSNKLEFNYGKFQGQSNIANYYYTNLELQKAERKYEELFILADSLDSDQYRIFSKRKIGNLYFKKGEYQKAIGFYNEALELIPDGYFLKEKLKIVYNAGNIFRHIGENIKALENYNLALGIANELNDTLLKSECFHAFATIHEIQGDYYTALDNYQQYLKISEEIGNISGIALANLRLGILYGLMEEFSKAFDYYTESLKIFEKLGNDYYLMYTYMNFGTLKRKITKYDEALKYYNNAIEIAEKIDSKPELGTCYLSIAEVYNLQGKYAEAEVLLKKALKFGFDAGNQVLIAYLYNAYSDLFFEQQRYEDAYTYGKKAYELASELGDMELIKNSSALLSKCSEKLGLYKDAHKYHVIFKTMNDSIFNEKNIKKITGIEYKYKHEKELQEIAFEQQKKDAVTAEEIAHQKTLRNSFIFGFTLMFLLAAVILRSFIQKRKTNQILAQQKHIIEETNEELKQSNEELHTTLNIVNEQKEHITSSINYASKIQAAVLPSRKQREKILPEHFILFKPLDIVSGDFFWVQKADNNLMIAAADCTGHGVPGAFMSMLGISFLNEITRNKNVRQPAQILDALRNKVKETLGQTGKENEAKDGMDISFYIIDTKTNILQFSGANNPLYIVRNKEIVEYKGDRQPIGIYIKEKEFTNYEIQLEPNDILYSFSDGYIDQFGGESNRKFMSKQFKQLLLAVHDKSMLEQKEILNQQFENWRNDTEQIDDVLVIGVKI